MKKTNQYFYTMALSMIFLFCVSCERNTDMSEFSEFNYKLEIGCPNMGPSFKVEEGTVASARIARLETSYLLEMTLFESGQTGVDKCLSGSRDYGMDCIITRKLASRNLEAAEVDEIKVVFKNIKTQRTFIPSGMRIEGSCPTYSMRWDNFSVADRYSAEGPTVKIVLVQETVEKVTAQLKQLAR